MGEATIGWPCRLNDVLIRRPMPLLCFYNEKVDLYVDGELQARPKSPFS